MLLRSLLLPFVPLAALPLLGSAPQKKDVQAPPGLVLVPGGKTQIGTDPKDIERMLADVPPLRATAAAFVGETPRKVHDVDDFFLMLTEVTNEQYAVYVSATGARPPYHWAEGALETARKAYLDEQGAARAAAVAAGEPPPPMMKFEDREWWAGNWEGQPWAIPAGLEDSPVVFVDYQDAEGYARWAGLRLMTELEYQRACRGDGDALYPWGDKWEDGKYAATQELGNRSDVLPMASFPDGASKQGLMDLAGNAWEWTSSKYVALEGYKHFKLEFGRGDSKEVIDRLPGFNADQRVLVGGSIQNSRYVARCTTRGGFERSQQTAALGFRCAASTLVGVDMAETVARDVPVELRPQSADGPIKYDPRLTLAMDRWTVAPENAQTRALEKAMEEFLKNAQQGQSDEGSAMEGAPTLKLPGYEVTAGYEYILFLPVERVFGVALKDLREASHEAGLVPIGLFSTDQELLEPALPPGTYVVSFRGQSKAEPPPVVEQEGKKKKDKKDKKGDKGSEEAAPAQDPPAPQEGGEPKEEPKAEKPALPPLEELIPIELTRDNFVIFDLTGKPVCAIPCTSLEVGAAQAGSIQSFDKTITKMVGEEEVEEIQKWMAFELYLPGRTSGRGFLTKIPLRFADGVIEGNWRK